jgi:hypothetical protein
VSGQSAISSAVAKVRLRLDQISERGERIGEQDTKAILIEPILAALGWDFSDLDDVRREYRHKPQDNPVDYALLIYGEPRLFVEAKAHGAPLDRKCASQVLGYASVVGVGWCLLTNGDEYRLYNSHATVDVDEKLLRSVRLSDQGQTNLCLETLLLVAKDSMGESELEALWKSQFVDRHVRAAVDELFSSEEPGLGRLLHRKCPELSLAEIRDSLRRASVHVHFPEVTTFAVETGTTSAGSKAAKDANKGAAPARVGVELADLLAAGLITAPLQLERQYKGITLSATIEADAKVYVDGIAYDSLSTAAGMARKSVIGAPPGREYPQTNGWTFWMCRVSTTDQKAPIDEVRQQYLARARQ